MFWLARAKAGSAGENFSAQNLVNRSITRIFFQHELHFKPYVVEEIHRTAFKPELPSLSKPQKK